MTRKKVDDIRVYKRWVKKALIGKSDKECSVLEILEDVNEYADHRLREIIGYYSDIKQKEEDRIRTEKEKEFKIKAFMCYESQPKDVYDEIKKIAMDKTRRIMNGFDVKETNPIFIGHVVREVMDRGLMSNKKENNNV